MLETQASNNFSLPQHCYEYLQHAGLVLDNFEHPQRVKLLYLGGLLSQPGRPAPEADRRRRPSRSRAGIRRRR